MAVLTSGEIDLNLGGGSCDREQKSPQRPLQRVSPGQLTSQKGPHEDSSGREASGGRPGGPSSVSSSDGGCHGLRACPALHRAEGPSPAGHGLFAWDLTGGVPVEKPRQLWGLPRGGPGPSLASERRTLGRGGLGWGERCSRQRKQHLGESVRKVSWPPPCRSEERCGGRGGAWSAVGWGEGARLEWHPPAGGRVLTTPLCLPWGGAREV